MEQYFPALVMGATLFPILILIPSQVYLTLKAKRRALQLIPMLLSVLALILCLFLLPEEGILKLVAVLYFLLLLILCGAGWVIAYSIKKSRRDP